MGRALCSRVENLTQEAACPLHLQAWPPRPETLSLASRDPAGVQGWGVDLGTFDYFCTLRPLPASRL